MKVAILGMGLIGGSLARTLAKRRPDWHLRGYSLDGGVAEAAAAGIDLAPAASIAEAATGADLAIAAVPPSETPDVLAACLEADASVAVTDTAGVKGAVLEKLSGHAMRARWIPGHPIAGREGAGFRSSQEDIFAGAPWILTPQADSDPAALAAVRRLLEALGAVRAEMSPPQHDRLLAHTSHLPHLVAWALLWAAAEADSLEGVLLGAGGGLRDLVRIATSPAPIWADISLANAPALRAAIAALQSRLQALDAALESSDRAAVEGWIADGAAIARELGQGLRQ